MQPESDAVRGSEDQTTRAELTEHERVTYVRRQGIELYRCVQGRACLLSQWQQSEEACGDFGLP